MYILYLYGKEIPLINNSLYAFVFFAIQDPIDRFEGLGAFFSVARKDNGKINTSWLSKKKNVLLDTTKTHSPNVLTESLFFVLLRYVFFKRESSPCWTDENKMMEISLEKSSLIQEDVLLTQFGQP